MKSVEKAMENRQEPEEYKPKDYTLERWIVAILSLLFILPFVAQA